MTALFSNFEQTLTTSPLLALVLVYIGGLLASLTPCVYPMLPVVAGVIGHANVGGTRLRAFLLSCVHVLGMALTYSALGFFAATTGRLFGAAASSPWTLLIVGNLMLLFALWMLDLIQLPTLTGPRLSRLADKGGLLGIFFAGIASALVAGPCTTPVLGALLTYAASTGSTFFGALLFFVFSLGLGTLLLLVGSFSGALTALPRSGEWMVRIKKGLGLLILATAEYFIFRAGMQSL